MSVSDTKSLIVTGLNPNESHRNIHAYDPAFDVMQMEPQSTKGDGNCLLHAFLGNMNHLIENKLIIVPKGFPLNHTALRKDLIDTFLKNTDFFLEKRTDIWKHSMVPSEENHQLVVPLGVTTEQFMSELSNRDWLMNAKYDGVYLNNFFVHAVASLMKKFQVLRASDLEPVKVFYMFATPSQEVSTIVLQAFEIEAFDFDRNVREEFAASKKPAASGGLGKVKHLRLDMGSIYIPKKAVSFESITKEVSSFLIIHQYNHYTWARHIKNRAVRAEKLKLLSPLLMILIHKLLGSELELLVQVGYPNFFGHDEILEITTDITKDLRKTDEYTTDLVLIEDNVSTLLKKIKIFLTPGSDGAASIETIIEEALWCEELVQNFVNFGSNDSSSAGSSSGKSPAAPTSSSGGVGGSSSMKRKNDVIELDH